MQFTSFEYIGFFAAVFAVYWFMPGKWRWAAALAASVGFYALFGLPMLAVLALCTAVSYAGGLWLSRRRGRKAALALTVTAASNTVTRCSARICRSRCARSALRCLSA